MYAKRLITIDYREHNQNITPTALGRSVVAEGVRIESREPLADVEPLVRAVSSQAAATNPLAWPAVAGLERAGTVRQLLRRHHVL